MMKEGDSWELVIPASRLCAEGAGVSFANQTLSSDGTPEGRCAAPASLTVNLRQHFP